MNQFKKYFPSIKAEAGVTLLVVIIAMVVVAILGAGLLALFSTSLFNQTEAQKTAKAYYLAESGIRVAASDFAHSTNQNATLISLQGKTFNFPATGGSFTLQIYPYWFYVNTSYSVNTASITLYFPGTLPPINSDSSTSITIPANGLVKLKNNTRVGVFTTAPSVGSPGANGTPVTFTIVSNSPCTTPCTGFPYSIIAGNELYLGYVYTLPPPAIIQGGDLVFTDRIDTAVLYPPANGSINIAQKDGIYQYTYESRIPQTIYPGSPPSSFTLHNIQPATGASPAPKFPIKFTYNPANPYDVSKTTQIYLGKTLGIQSAATYGN
jgi:type II secretory pathway pseudopilin PulG